MNEIESLVQEYEKVAGLPWEKTVAGPQRVWFAVYDPGQERRLRLRLDEFEVATKTVGHEWKLLDITDTFAVWMSNHEYREAYFEQPDDMDLALKDYLLYLVELISGELSSSNVNENTVVALLGVGALFGLVRASEVIENGVSKIQGRLLVFFPGQRDGSNYRLLDARDGWNYLAIPISAEKGK
jgi:hypothetical protein